MKVNVILLEQLVSVDSLIMQKIPLDILDLIIQFKDDDPVFIVKITRLSSCFYKQYTSDAIWEKIFLKKHPFAKNFLKKEFYYSYFNMNKYETLRKKYEKQKSKEYISYVIDDELNIVLTGSFGNGKTAMIIHHTQGIFFDQSDPLTEDSYRKYAKTYNHKCVIDVFDVAGAYEHNEDTSAWYTKKANCFLFSCALDNRQSLLDLETNWIPLAKKILQTDVLPSILVANKDDDSAQRVITTEELEEFAQKHNIQCVRQVSAKTGKGIEELFKTAAHIAFDAKHGIHQVYRMLEARQPLQFVEPKMSPFLQKKKNCIVM